ncbi:hypothetical protein ACFE04_001251 [Oxalis oulophora]
MKRKSFGDGGGGRSPVKRILTTKINCFDNDTLCLIFSFLDLFDLARCSLVNKYWCSVINNSKLLQELYYKLQGNNSSTLGISSNEESSFSVRLEALAMKHHNFSLRQGDLNVHQWKAHSLGVSQCRMKMGMVLTGVGDKVMRLWSMGSYKCMGEYSVPNTHTLLDFDFDESKIVGLLGTQICIWMRNASRSIFPSRQGTFGKGTCIRYFDPEAVVGCDDGTARVYDMYSRTCSRIIRMHSASITSLALGDEHLIFSGSSLGSITISGLHSNERVATLRSSDRTGIKTLCYNLSSNQIFAGMTGGYASCWDLRMMKPVWQNRVSPNVIYSLQHLRNDTSTLVAGGIDGLLRVLDQNSGEILSTCIMDSDLPSRTCVNKPQIVEQRKGMRLLHDTNIDKIPIAARPQITCLAVGMKKVVTTHNSKYIRVWEFNK